MATGIRMLRTSKGSPNGREVETYEEGKVYSLGLFDNNLYDFFVTSGAAEFVDEDEPPVSEPEPVVSPYESMTIAQLKNELEIRKDKGHDVTYTAAMKKPELIELLQIDDIANPAESETDSGDDDDDEDEDGDGDDEPETLLISACSACGEDHEVEVLDLDEPVTKDDVEYTRYFVCPNKGDEVLVETAPESEEPEEPAE